MRFPQGARPPRVHLRTLRCCHPDRLARRSSIPVSLSAWNIARISPTHVFDAPAAAQTSLIVTSTFPRIALEYVQICSAASTTSCATLRSSPGTLMLSRACRK